MCRCANTFLLLPFILVNWPSICARSEKNLTFHLANETGLFPFDYKVEDCVNNKLLQKSRRGTFCFVICLQKKLLVKKVSFNTLKNGELVFDRRIELTSKCTTLWGDFKSLLVVATQSWFIWVVFECQIRHFWMIKVSNKTEKDVYFCACQDSMIKKLVGCWLIFLFVCDLAKDHHHLGTAGSLYEWMWLAGSSEQNGINGDLFRFN